MKFFDFDKIKAVFSGIWFVVKLIGKFLKPVRQKSLIFLVIFFVGLIALLILARSICVAEYQQDLECEQASILGEILGFGIWIDLVALPLASYLLASIFFFLIHLRD